MAVLAFAREVALPKAGTASTGGTEGAATTAGEMLGPSPSQSSKLDELVDQVVVDGEAGRSGSSILLVDGETGTSGKCAGKCSSASAGSSGSSAVRADVLLGLASNGVCRSGLSA